MKGYTTRHRLQDGQVTFRREHEEHQLSKCDPENGAVALSKSLPRTEMQKRLPIDWLQARDKTKETSRLHSPFPQRVASAC